MYRTRENLKTFKLKVYGKLVFTRIIGNGTIWTRQLRPLRFYDLKFFQSRAILSQIQKSVKFVRLVLLIEMRQFGAAGTEGSH